ncbi:putative solute carrier family 35 member SLC35F1/F2/F6 [Helianthus annuus]|nr:putative solute carrier family 35 member SLC35F1/F2/F6 [Helianthus annuus]
MWSVLIRIFAYHEKYFVAFVAVAIGLVVYSGFDKENHADEAADLSRYLDEEAGDPSSNKHLAASSSGNIKGDDAVIKKI